MRYPVVTNYMWNRSDFFLSTVSQACQPSPSAVQHCRTTNTSSLAGTCRTPSERRRTNDDVAPSSSAAAALTNDANTKTEPTGRHAPRLLSWNRSPNKRVEVYAVRRASSLTVLWLAMCIHDRLQLQVASVRNRRNGKPLATEHSAEDRQTDRQTHTHTQRERGNDKEFIFSLNLTHRKGFAPCTTFNETKRTETIRISWV